MKKKQTKKRRVMCFSCNKRRIKYVDGLCVTCHKVAIAVYP